MPRANGGNEAVHANGGMHNSLPYVVRKALNDAGFSDDQMRDLVENQASLLKGLKRRYDARQGETNLQLASRLRKSHSSRSGEAIEVTGS